MIYPCCCETKVTATTARYAYHVRDDISPSFSVGGEHQFFQASRDSLAISFLVTGAGHELKDVIQNHSINNPDQLNISLSINESSVNELKDVVINRTTETDQINLSLSLNESSVNELKDVVINHSINNPDQLNISFSVTQAGHTLD